MRLAMLGAIQILVLASTFAESPCRKPVSQWSEKEAKKFLAESAWSRTTTFVSLPAVSALDGDAQIGTLPTPRDVINPPRGYGLDKGSGIHGEKELYYRYTCRLYSAMPIREAYLRFWGARSKYDKMSAEEQRVFDDKASKLLEAGGAEDIVVAVELSSNDRRMAMEVERRLREVTKEQLRQGGKSFTGDLLEQAPFLISDHAGRVELKAYYPPSPEGTGAKLVFPREIDGEPVVTAEDKELKLEFIVPGSGHKLYIVWKVRDLICDNEPVL
jgi:hypothetical protein